MSKVAEKWAKNSGTPDHVYRLLMALAEWHNITTGKCNPSNETICRKVGKTRSTVQASLKRAEDLGLIERIPMFPPGKKKNTTNQHDLKLDAKLIDGRLVRDKSSPFFGVESSFTKDARKALIIHDQNSPKTKQKATDKLCPANSKLKETKQNSDEKPTQQPNQPDTYGPGEPGTEQKLTKVPTYEDRRNSSKRVNSCRYQTEVIDPTDTFDLPATEAARTQGFPEERDEVEF